mgnify:CR=1 FL=1
MIQITGKIMMSFKYQEGFFVLLFFGILVNAQNKSFFISPPNYELVSTDLHIHTAFSDGLVWPNIRVDEALKEGLDLISITDHLEYQPHKKDIPHPDRNRSFDIAKEHAKDRDLSVIKGAEITRSMPPGHINAVFIEDVNKLLFPNDAKASIVEANKQSGFVFWNHPNWESQRPDGIARLEPLHRELIEKKLLHGIEVVNFTTLSEEAITIALDNNLTILGTSDIHGLTSWDFKISEGGHRPITFVLSKSKSVEDVKKALFQGKTMVWFKELIIGKKEHLSEIIKANLTVSPISYKKNQIIAKVLLNNHSSTPFHLLYKGPFTFHEDSDTFTIPPYGEKIILVKTLERKKSLDLPFELLNGIIGNKKHLEFTISTP